MKKGRKIRGVFQRDGQWWIRWTCSLEHDHRKLSGELKTAASEEQKTKRAEVREARKSGLEYCPRLVERTRPKLFRDILADYMEYSARTKRSHTDDRPKRDRFRALYGDRLASSITSKDIEDFKASFAQEPVRRTARGATANGGAPVEHVRTVATVNHYLKFLKAVFNRAIRQGHLTYNPVRAVKLYREHNARNRCLSPEEEGRLMAALPPSLAPLVLMALHTGMRRGELRALRWDDVDFSTGTLRIRQDKAGDGRWVALNRVALDALRTVKRDQKVMSAFVFCSPEGKFLHNFERSWRPALQAAQIPDFRFHDCRHSFASRLAMGGTDLYTVQRAGGWKSQAMVQRYAHLSPDHIRAAVEKLARGDSGGATGTRTGTES